MARAKRKARTAEVVYTQLAIRVERHDVSLDATINHAVYEPQYADDLDESDPLYGSTSILRLKVWQRTRRAEPVIRMP